MSFSIPPKNVHLKTLLYIICWHFANLADYYKSFINTSMYFPENHDTPRIFKLEYLSIILGDWHEFDLSYLLIKNRNDKVDYLSKWTSFAKVMKKPWFIKCTCTYLLDNFVKRRCQHSIAYLFFFVYINCNICALGSRLLSNLVVIWHRFLIDC